LAILLHHKTHEDCASQDRKIVLNNPALPDELDRLSIKNLAIADAVVDLTLFRHDRAIAVTVLRKVGDVEAIVLH
jgi:hypothetical protein